MTALTLDTIPKKFYPSIINRDDFAEPSLKEKVESAFKDMLSSNEKIDNKGHVFERATLPGYVIKAYRQDHLKAGLAPDTHVYRVRKALKIQRLVDKYELGSHVKVPKKHLWYDTAGNKWYVIAEKLELSNKAPRIDTHYFDDDKTESFNSAAQQNPAVFGKLPALINAAKSETTSQAITPEQARALTIFAYEAGLTDLSLLNMAFTKDGKFAVMDTEPVKRLFLKSFKNIFIKIFGNKDLVKLRQSAAGVMKLRISISDPKTLATINRTENYYLAIASIKALATLAILATLWSYSVLIPISIGVFVVKACLALKIANLVFDVLTSVFITVLARKEHGAGLQIAHTMELQGLC